MNEIHIEQVSVTKLEPNKWNPNQVDDSTYAKVKRSIKAHGFVVPITAYRRKPESKMLTIINGEHRWLIAQELGLEKVPVIVLDVTTADARELTINLNELGGNPDPRKYGEMVQWFMDQGQSMGDIESALPLTKPEIEELLAEHHEQYEDSIEEVEREREETVKRVQTERVHEVRLGPFSAEEYREVDSILSDSELVARWTGTVLLLKLLRKGKAALKRLLEKEVDNGTDR